MVRALRRRLRTAADRGEITDSVGEVLRLVQVARVESHQVIEVPKGGRNFKRSSDQDQFTRRDGAHFDFAITLDNGEPIAWCFELRFPEDWSDGPGWVRFDLNHVGHANDMRGHRCHLHLGSDDDGMEMPLPTLEPLDVLEMILTRLQKTGRERGQPATSG